MMVAPVLTAIAIGINTIAYGVDGFYFSCLIALVVWGAILLTHYWINR